MEKDWEVRIAHSQSSNNKVWVVLTKPDGSEKSVGFKSTDAKEILQVDEYYYEDLTSEEKEDPLIKEAQVVLALSCYYPDQFISDKESGEVISYLEGAPSEYISAKHIQKVLQEFPNIEEWEIYTQIKLSDSSNDEGDEEGSESGSFEDSEGSFDDAESESGSYESSSEYESSASD